MDKNDLRKKALKAIDATVFYPARGKERIRSMIETRPDWCISRQRVWGVPLPIFISKKTKEPLRDPEIVENIAKIYEKDGADCWFDGNPQKFLGKKYKIEDYIQSTDICEVWFDSGSTHSFVLEKRKDLMWPASMYLEGSDQHRGWFHSSLLEFTKSLNSLEGLNNSTFLLDITFFSLVNGFLPILLFLLRIEKVPNLEIFNFLFFFKFSIIVCITSSNRFSEIFFEKPICI